MIRRVDRPSRRATTPSSGGSYSETPARLSEGKQLKPETLHNTFSVSLEEGRRAASALADAAFLLRPQNRKEIAFLAARIRECNRERNVIKGEFLNKESGEIFEASAKFWYCGSKLCPSCVAREARRNRKKLQLALKRQKLTTSERYRFITFTIQNPGLSLLETREIVNAAWRKFSRSKYWRSVCVGFCKSEEFTLTAKGYHYHLHVLARAKYIDFAKLRVEWTTAVGRFFFEVVGQEMKPSTSDKLLIVNVSPIVSLNKAIQEVAKYITKSNSWRKLPMRDLLEVASIERWHRMFELGGTFSPKRRKDEILHYLTDFTASSPDDERGQQGQSSINKTILDTKSLSVSEAAGRCESWRRQCRKLPTHKYAKRLLFQIKHTRTVRIAQIKAEGLDFECSDFPDNRELLGEALKLASWIQGLESPLSAL